MRRPAGPATAFPDHAEVYMSARALHCLILAVMAASSCQATRGQEDEDYQFTLRDPGVWAGTDMVVSSPAFGRADVEVSVSIDGVGLEQEWVNNNTIAFAVPAGFRGGSYRPDLLLDGRELVLPEVIVYGFEEMIVHGRSIEHPIRQLDIPGGYMLGNAVSGMVAVDLATGVGQDGPGVPVAGEVSLGPTSQPDVWAVRETHSSAEVGLWRFGAGPATKVGAVPVNAQSTAHAMAVVSDLRALAYHGSAAFRYARSGDGPWQMSSLDIRSDGGPEVHLSPRGDRIAVTSSGSGDMFGRWRGTPVYSTIGEIDTAFVLRKYRASSVIAFSPDGKEIGMSVSAHSGSGHAFIRVDATTGEYLQDDDMPFIGGLAYDRSRPLVYASYRDDDRNLRVLRVISTTTGEVVAEVESPQFCEGRCPWTVGVVASTTDDHLYIGIPGAPFKVARFRLPPKGSLR